MRPLLLPCLLAVLAGSATPQDSCEGNHLGPVYMETSPGYLGGTFEIDLGSPVAPLGLGLLSVSDGFGPVFHPLLGIACLDMYSPFYQIFLVPLDAAGNFHLSVGLPADPALLGAPPIYGAPTAFVAGQIWNGKTIPLYYTFPNSWTPTGDLPAERAFQRATALGNGPADNRIKVFLSGGAKGTLVAPLVTDETWLYEPLNRTFLAGPTLATERVFHTQTKLFDDRLLIVGGNDTQGICHASGEIYDHATGALTPIAPMSAPRSGHAATLLPDGRVLVTGGLADYQIGASSLAAVLNTAQTTAEIYDPATDTWTPASNPMASRRAGHGQVLWPDGRVLVISGINGGTSVSGLDTATFTPTCSWYSPVTNSFSPAPSLTTTSTGAAFFGQSFLGDGRLLVSGGLATVGFGGSQASTSAFTFDGAAWSPIGFFFGLPQGVAFHTQETLADGRALIVGGFIGDLATLTGSQQVLIADGVSFQSAAPIGTSTGTSAPGDPRGGHTMTRLWDGSFLVLGGMDGSSLLPQDQWTLDTGYVYAP
jgi:hypothetical protein